MTIKILNRRSVILCISALLLFTSCSTGGSIPKRIAHAAQVCNLKVSDIEELDVADGKRWNKYDKKYRFFIEQPIDHTDPEVGTFKQRVVLMHCGFKNPTLLVTEGYSSRGSNPKYSNELSDLFETNIVEVEHRYFNESIPFKQDDSTITDDSLNWDYMTARNAAADLHNVNRLLKEIYKGKWIASGISKGGQTAMFYTAYYPEDIDISVPYVGPVCTAVEDGRHEPFLEHTAGTQADRDMIRAFQIEMLKRRESIAPMFADIVETGNMSFRVPLSTIYDFCILEFPFAFWQMGFDTSVIPDFETTADEDMLKVMLDVTGPDYFAIGSDSSPFFVQAAKELGYYGYDTEPLKEYLTIESATGYLKQIFLPDQEFEFDDYLHNDINNFLDTTSSKMLFVYGEFDPWSSVMPQAPVMNEELKREGHGRDNMYLFIDPHGSHRARILTLPDTLQTKAIGVLKQWLEE